MLAWTLVAVLSAMLVTSCAYSVLIAISTFGILYVLGMENWFWIGCSVIVGLLVGIVIEMCIRDSCIPYMSNT